MSNIRSSSVISPPVLTSSVATAEIAAKTGATVSSSEHSMPESTAVLNQIASRTPLEFDSGLNTSNAWTSVEHGDLALSDEDNASIRSSLSLSPPSTNSGTLRGHDRITTNTGKRVNFADQPNGAPSSDEVLLGRSARAIYDFHGKPEFQELSFSAGDALRVINQDLPNGWSTAKVGNKVGLVPRTYYIYTTEFESTGPNFASSSSLTQSPIPNTSPTTSTLLSQAQTLFPQTTGEWFTNLSLSNIGGLPNIRKSLLGGKSLNRFSSFVTSGAEEWVLRGSVNDKETRDGKKSTKNGHGHARGVSAIEERFRTISGLPISSDTWDSDEKSGFFHSKESSSNPEDDGEDGDADKSFIEAHHQFIDAGPTWKAKIPHFRIYVHSPTKRTDGIKGQYVVYSVTSVFGGEEDGGDEEEDEKDGDANADSEEHWDTRFGGHTPTPSSYDPSSYPSSSSNPNPPRTSPLTKSITVHRRFSHFVLLHTLLSRQLPALALPPLPAKSYAGRFSADFVEARRMELQRYLRALVRHPVVRGVEVVMWWLSCESDYDWYRQLPQYTSAATSSSSASSPQSASFYANVYHPMFNIDVEDAEHVLERFDNHTRAVERGVQELRGVYGRIRGARVEMSNAERLLSYSLLSLITSTPLGDSSVNLNGEDEDERQDEDSEVKKKSKTRGLLNKDGAWCWKEDCSDCLKLTKSLQKTAEAMQGVADLYDNHARRTMLDLQESLKDVAYPSALFAPVVDTHASTLDKYKEAVDQQEKDENENEDVAARCETVLNTTMAEFEMYHSHKVEDFGRIAKDHLDGEIEFYEKILNRLRAARQTFDPQNSELLSAQLSGARQPSIYERELGDPSERMSKEALVQPSPHVYDSAPIRPVSVAVKGGMEMLFGGGSGSMVNGNGNEGNRASVFAKLW